MNIVTLREGFPHWILFWELYNKSRQLGMGALDRTGQRQMTLGEAYIEYQILQHNSINGEVCLDYHRGRVMKVDLGSQRVRADLYDRDNGEGKFEEIVQKIERVFEAINPPYSDKENDPYHTEIDKACNMWFGYESLFESRDMLDHWVERYLREGEDHFCENQKAWLAEGTSTIPSLIVSRSIYRMHTMNCLKGKTIRDMGEEIVSTINDHQKSWFDLVNTDTKPVDEAKLIADNPLTIRRLEL